MKIGRATMAAALAAALTAPVAGAQSVFESEARVAPQYLQYWLGAPSNETISQLAIPLFVSVPITPSFTFDVGTAYARSRVSSDRGTSEISGLTDTQIRGNLTLGSDFVVLTAGINLPTGHRSVTLDEFATASRIASDFLSFPISNVGAGYSGTGGLAVARPLGVWNAGFGFAVRRSNSYEPFNIPEQSLRYQPGHAYRARFGLDRAAGDGRVALGLTYSAFGQDDAGGARFRTGNRVVMQSVYTKAVDGNDLVLGAYDIVRLRGHYASGDPSGQENLANVFASLATHPGGTLIEPSLELRHWQQEVPQTTIGTTVLPSRAQNSYLGTIGLRTSLDLVGVSAFPSVGWTFGALATSDAAGAPSRAGLTGFRAQLSMRVVPFGGQ
ncbi:MAG: hypothetical protein JWN53_955 [Gemmatimonadetes bacterium]|nr:hypothetical protein [Gemmatimonadota bacterium]